MRNRKRVLVVDDAANLNQDRRDHSWRINHEAILTYAAGLGTIVEAGIYFPRYTGIERDRGDVIGLKQGSGFTQIEVRPVRQRPDGTYKSDIDTVITMAVWGAAVAGLVDTVVLASGDSDFVPLVERLLARGIETHVIGPDSATAIELAVAASCFVYTSQVPGLVQPVSAPLITAIVSQAQAARTAERTGGNGNGQHGCGAPALQKPL
jgi:hypothetical protein